MRTLSKSLFTAVSLVALTGTALAQAPDDAAPPADPPADPNAGGGDATAPATTDPAPATDGAAATTSPITVVGKGKILIAGSTLNVNMSTDAVAKPISIAPSVWYGVSDKLAVGLTHDGGTTPYSPRPFPGLGICLSGEENGCGKVYDNVGVDVLFGIKDEAKMGLAVHGGVIVESFDPMTLSLRAGVLGKYNASDKLSVVFDPAIFIGLTERDGAEIAPGVTAGGNKEVIDVPVWVWFNVNEKLGAYLHTGINGPLDGFGDAFLIPLGVGATYKVNDKLGVGGDFHFLGIAGSDAASADFRTLGIRAQYAL